MYSGFISVSMSKLRNSENALFRDNRAFEGYEWGNVTIDTVCELLTDTRAEGAVDGLARVNDLTLMMEGERCLDHTYQAEVGH